MAVACLKQRCGAGLASLKGDFQNPALLNSFAATHALNNTKVFLIRNTAGGKGNFFSALALQS